jgi:hypothetical protein
MAKEVMVWEGDCRMEEQRNSTVGEEGGALPGCHRPRRCSRYPMDCDYSGIGIVSLSQKKMKAWCDMYIRIDGMNRR